MFSTITKHDTVVMVCLLEWIWTHSLHVRVHVYLHHYSLNTKLDAYIEDDANTDVKCKQSFKLQIISYFSSDLDYQ